ncbi:MAG: GNAT family N-acetyltransferase [Candidatus Micrarchaeota archaeon]
MAHIRELARGDAKDLASFLLRLSPETLRFWNRFGKLSKSSAYAVAKRQASLKKNEERGYVALDGRTIVGYGFLRFFPEKPQKKTTCSLGIAVEDRYQNMGIGSALVEKMIREARRLRMRKIWLGTYSSNSRALKFYRNLGFQVEGVFMSDEYFDGKPFHTASMALFLDGTGDANKARRAMLMDAIEKGKTDR